MNTTIDLLQIKIDKARSELPEEVRDAIDSTPWKTVILSMRVERGYSFTQLENLQIATELLLCGLLDLNNYPIELQKRMAIPKPQVEELINEMNEKVFKKIRERLVRNIEEKKMSEAPKESEESEEQSLKKIESPAPSLHGLESREELLAKIENPEPTNKIKIGQQKINGGEPATPTEKINLEVPEAKQNDDNKTPSILTQRLSGISMTQGKTTDHSLMNITKDPEEKIKVAIKDPYREPTQ